MFLHFSEQVAVAQALAPAADRYNTGPSTDVFSLKNYSKGVFILQQGAGALGRATVQAFACDNVAGDNPVAIPFSYRVGDADGQNLGELVQVDENGFTTAAAANKVTQIEIQADQLGEGKPCVYLDFTETVDDPVAAGVLFLGLGGRYQGASNLKAPTL